MASLDRAQIADVLANMQALGQTDVPVDGKGTRLEIDTNTEPEYQTDKKMVKLVPCRECKRPLVTTTFFAPAKALCRVCKGEAGDTGVATVGQPVPGQTDPAKAVHLADCLVNPHFAFAVCPVHPDDEAHEMQLVSVNHSDHYGPGHFDAKGNFHQTAPGETAVLQCQKCLAAVTYTTTYRQRFRAQNEPKIKPDLGEPGRFIAERQGTR